MGKLPSPPPCLWGITSWGWGGGGGSLWLLPPLTCRYIPVSCQTHRRNIIFAWMQVNVNDQWEHMFCKSSTFYLFSVPMKRLWLQPQVVRTHQEIIRLTFLLAYINKWKIKGSASSIMLRSIWVKYFYYFYKVHTTEEHGIQRMPGKNLRVWRGKTRE